MLEKKEYQEQSQGIVDQLRSNRYSFELSTLAGPEQIFVDWVRVSQTTITESYKIVVTNKAGKPIADIQYEIDKLQDPPVARVINKNVEVPYRGKDISKRLFALMAKDLENRGVNKVVGQIRKENTAALVARQHVRELLTGRRYLTKPPEEDGDNPNYNYVTTRLDQFEDEQGET